MDEFMHELKIPKARIAVLIGTNGETKKELEEYTKTKIDVDSKEGLVTITGNDAVKLYTVRELVLAIGRGFNPEIAKLLLKQDYCIEILSLDEFADKKKKLERIRGRIIGKKGKSREIIENLTETHVSVYGKTVSIIGLAENVTMARNAVEMFLEGAAHSAVYRRLEQFRRNLKEHKLSYI